MASVVSNTPQLSPENLRELQAARNSLRKVRRAVTTAKFEGYSVAISGLLTFLMGIGSIGQMFGGIVLAVIGIIEIVSASRLSQLDVRAGRVLTINQLSLAALILLYAVGNIYGETMHPEAAAELQGISQSDSQALGDVTSLTHEITLLMYGAMIGAAVVEAAMARYYHSRVVYLERYLAETPPWIVAMQKTGSMV